MPLYTWIFQLVETIAHSWLHEICIIRILLIVRCSYSSSSFIFLLRIYAYYAIQVDETLLRLHTFFCYFKRKQLAKIKTKTSKLHLVPSAPSLTFIFKSIDRKCLSKKKTAYWTLFQWYGWGICALRKPIGISSTVHNEMKENGTWWLKWVHKRFNMCICKNAHAYMNVCVCILATKRICQHARSFT